MPVRSYFQFPDKQEILTDSITAIAIDGSDATKVNIGLGGSISDYVFTAQSAFSATQALDFINVALLTGRTGKIIVPNQDTTAGGTGGTWSSISPNTESISGDGGFFSAVVTGTGIGDIVSLELQLDDGSGHVITLSLSGGSGDTVYVDNLSTTGFSVTGTYHLYWKVSPNPWTDTGLTVTVSA